MAGAKEHLKSMIPDSLLLGQLVLRRAAAWQQEGLIFVHVPKNGGTSINNAIYGRFMGHCRVRDIERVRPDLLRAMPSLAVARNPWARAYSAWNFARKGAAMRDGAKIHDPGRYQKPEFKSFERFVLEWLPSRDLDREDYVFRPQVHFLRTRAGAIGVKHLGHIEEEESYQEYLFQALGRQIRISHMNRTTGPLHYRKAYTLEMRNTLARCYAEDLDTFEYDF